MSPECSQPSRTASAVASGLAPVALHHVAAADAHLRRRPGRQAVVLVVHDGDLDAVDRAAAGARSVLIGVRVGGRDRGGLGQPVAVAHRAGELALEIDADFVGERGPAGPHPVDRTRVVALAPREVEHVGEHRRHHAQPLDPVALDVLEHLAGVPAHHQRRLEALDEADAHHQHTERVGHRHHVQDRHSLRHLGHAGDLLR